VLTVLERKEPAQTFNRHVLRISHFKGNFPETRNQLSPVKTITISTRTFISSFKSSHLIPKNKKVHATEQTLLLAASLPQPLLSDIALKKMLMNISRSGHRSKTESCE
jgi:hypothetical protein